MSTYRVDIGGEVREVFALSELKRMARAGDLQRGHRVRRGAGPWMRAVELPGLEGVFDVDLWDAWEDLVDAPAEAEPGAALASTEEAEATPKPAPKPKPDFSNLRRREAELVRRERERQQKQPRRAAEVPTDRQPARAGAESVSEPQIEKVREAPRRIVPLPQRDGVARLQVQPDVAGPNELPVEALQPLDVEPMGQVIAFPGSGRAPPPPPRPEAFAEPVEVAVRPVRPKRRPPRSVIPMRWWFMAAFLLMFAGGTWMMVWYVRSLAYWTPRMAQRGPVTPNVGEQVEAAAEPPEGLMGAASVDPSELEAAALLRELRDTLGPGIRDVGDSQEQFQDALFIDLQRLVSAKTVKVDVISWTSSRNPMPELVEIGIWINSDGDPMRELGAAGLVAGRYIQHYELQVRRLEVNLVQADGRSQGRTFEGKHAGDLFTGHQDLLTFLLP